MSDRTLTVRLITRVVAVLVVGIASVPLGGCQWIGGGKKISIESNFSVPESALHDLEHDVYLVSNINADPFGGDGAGYISKLSPEGEVIEAKWIDGSKDGVTLNAPKGMAISGGYLYVADVNAVRKFDVSTGAPAGDIPIAGATFLNDLATALDGTVYVSDTGMSPGFEPSGSDAIYAISRDGTVRTLVKSTSLSRPNGLLVDGDTVLMVNWEGGSLSRVKADGSVEEICKLPKAQLDGIVVCTDGSLLISSWEGSCIYRVQDGEITAVIEGVEAPADIGYDKNRGRLLLPYFKGNRVDIIPQ
ncbi:MAG: hypothetical protein AAF517_21115 [Planctomycetota bacterium]